MLLLADFDIQISGSLENTKFTFAGIHYFWFISNIFRVVYGYITVTFGDVQTYSSYRVAAIL